MPTRRIRRCAALAPPWALAVAAALLAVPASAQVQPAASVDTGVHVADSVASGLVFEGGRFVAGPYSLRRQDTQRAVEVLVAGQVLDRLPVEEGPAPSRVERAPAEYEIPQGVHTLRDSGYPLWLNRFVEYHAAREGLAQALDRAAAHASKSPLVARIERLEDGIVIVDHEADPYFVGANPAPPHRPLSRVEAQQLADRTLRVYADLLARGGAILRFADQDVFLPRERVEDLLIPSLLLLDDAKLEPAAKRRRLVERWGDERIAEQLLGGHAPSVALALALARYADSEAR